MRPILRLKAFLWRVSEPARRNAAYFKQRRLVFAVVAAVGFPLYYYIWNTVFPQPYENLPLRLAGSAIFLPMVFERYWPQAWRKYLPAYWYLALLFGLPFFFSFMLFKNDGSAIWVESTLVAVFIMLLLLDWLSMLVLSVVGVGLAWLAYSLTTDAPHISLTLLQHLPIISFAIVLGAISNYAAETIRLEQGRAMLATASSIAHELRTPLLGIKTGAAGLRNFLPTLISTYLLARERKLDVAPIRTAHLEAMKGVLERIESEANYSNAIIDVLIANVRLPEVGQEVQLCSLRRCVDQALERYPFSSRERGLVSWSAGGDIQFRGSELLMVHVVFNLLKNALRHIAIAGKGDISIRLDPSRAGRLVFRDTGSGIPPAVLPHIFKRFYSSASGGDGVLGSGIGLAFCRDVMLSIGGSIECASAAGQYTEFVLTFPDLTA